MEVVLFLEINHLSEDFIEEAIEKYYGQPKLKAEGARKPAVEYPGPMGNTPRRVENLINENEEDLALLKQAEVVIGVDSFTGNSTLFYGREILETLGNLEALRKR